MAHGAAGPTSLRWGVVGKKAKKPLVVEVVTDPAELDPLLDDWAALAEQVAVGQFGFPSFALEWWRRHGSGRLLVAVARKGDRLIGLLPLHERAYGVGHVIRWLGHGLGTMGAALVAPDANDPDEVAAALWQAVADAASPRVALQLTEHRLDAPGLVALRSHDAWDVRCELRSMVPVIDLRGTSLEALLAGTAKRKLRHTLTTAERDLDAAGVTWSTEIVDDLDTFEGVLPEIDAAFDASEAADAKLHLLAGEHRAATLDALRACFERQQAVVAMVRIDGRVVAFDISLRAGRQLFGYIRRHDPVARAYSPGHLLMRAGVEDAIGRGIEVFDLGLGADPYKLRWANDHYDAVVVTGGRTGSGGVAASAVAGLDGLFELRRKLLTRD